MLTARYEMAFASCSENTMEGNLTVGRLRARLIYDSIETQ